MSFRPTHTLTSVAVLLVFLATAGLGFASDDSGELRGFDIEHRSVDEAYLLVAPYLSPTAEIRVLRWESRIEVRDSVDVLEQIAAELAAFDVARRRIAVSIRLIRGERSEQAPGDEEVAGETSLPPNVKTALKYNVYTTVGESELIIQEGGERSVLLGDDRRFRGTVRLGSVDPRGEAVELENFSLDRRMIGDNGRAVYRPVFQFRERLETGKARVLFATPGADDRRALFLLLRVTVVEP